MSEHRRNGKQTAKSSRRRYALRGVAAAAALAVGASVGLTRPADAALPGTNGKIAFVSERDGNDEIYVMNAGGTGEKNLTNDLATDYSPAWSPDGKQIAFTSDRSGNNDIWVMNADGTGLNQLTTSPAGDGQPSWSPNGQLVFTSHRDGNSEIYTMNPDGTAQTRRTNDVVMGPGTDFSPTFASDGSDYILFTTSRDPDGGSYREELVIMGPGGGWLQVSPADNLPIHRDANWSPRPLPVPSDYRAILYVTNSVDIYAMRLNGTNPLNVTNHEAPDVDPAWSPDYQKIVFSSDRRGNPQFNMEIYVMNADGTGVTQLTDSPGYDDQPDWQPKPAGSPACTITGTAGNDTLVGTPLNDVICGGGGNDTISGGSGNDILRGGTGADKLYGQAGLDRLDGQDGNDKLFGGVDDDSLYGGNHDDTLEGGLGVDLLDSGTGSDTCKQEAADTPAAC